MTKKIKREGAITLVALVISIIVILILAGISIQTLMGENGIINKASIAKEESKKKEYKEELEIIGIDLEEKEGINLSSEEFMEKYKEKIVADAMFEGAKLNGPIDEDGTIVIIVKTKEGYVYKVTRNKVEYIDKTEETTPPTIKDSDIEGVCEPTGWTNGKVQVTLNINNTDLSNYGLQYSLDGKTNWKTYSGPITFEDNGKLFVRLKNKYLEYTDATVVNVANIDRLAPKQFVPTATSTTNSVTLTGSTTDAPKTEKDGCSGIKEYYFSNDNGATWKQNSNKLATSYTFNSLTQNKEYTLKMKAVDKAGNEVVTNAITKTTGKVPSLTDSNVKIEATPTGWTKKVEVTITTEITGYTLRYSTDGITWKNYTQKISITDNGPIYAQLWDGTNAGGYATKNITNIDNEAPEIIEFITNNAYTAGAIIGLKDNNELKSVKVSNPNGENLNLYDADNSQLLNNTSSINAKEYRFIFLDDKDGVYKITAEDEAGNIKEKFIKIKFLFKAVYNGEGRQPLADQCTTITGGWLTNYWKSTYGDIDKVTYGDLSNVGTLTIKAEPSTVNGRLGTWYTKNEIDLTEYDYLRDAKYNFLSTTSDNLWLWAGTQFGMCSTAEATSWAVTTLDISDIKEKRTIITGMNNGDTSKSYDFYIPICYMYKISDSDKFDD